MTLKQVLEKTIQREIDSQHLYADLSGRVREQAAKDAFEKLVEQEREHQTILEKYLRGELKKGALSISHVVDYKIAERLDQPEISPNMTLREIFLLAANRERMSHEFYVSLAEVHPAGEVKKLLKRLATQELQHKQRVELLYTQVAFPQTDGG